MSILQTDLERKPMTDEDFSTCRETFLENLNDTVKTSPIPIKALCPDYLRVRPGTIYSGLTADPPKFSAFHLLPLMLGTGNFEILFYFCRVCGFQAIRLPEKLNAAKLAQLLGDLLVVAAELQRVALQLVYKPGSSEQRKETRKHLDWILAIATTLRSALEKESDATK